MSPNTFPRITLPGVEVDPVIRKALDDAEAHDAFIRRQQRLMARAMVALGKPVFRSGKAKRRKASKNLAYAAKMQTRSAYLDARAFDDGVTEFAA